MTENLLSVAVGLQNTIAERYSINFNEDLVRFEDGKNVILNIENTYDVAVRERDSSRVYTQVLCEYNSRDDSSKCGTLAVRNDFIAYRLFNGASGDAVRVLERSTCRRHLIKHFKFEIADLQWAPHTSLLAVIDMNANLYVYSINESDFTVSKYINIIREDESVPEGHCPHIAWCAYVPEHAGDIVHMIAIYFGQTVEILTLNIIKESVDVEELDIQQVRKMADAYTCLPKENIPSSETIKTVCLSPDATAVAVAMDTGVVTFFIIDGEVTRFAHSWRPEATWRFQNLIFVDNVKSLVDSSDQFWKYAIISTDEGRRIQIYDTEIWTCKAQLLLESKDNSAKLSFMIDSLAKIIIAIDFEAANLYCITLAYSRGMPYFYSCTLTTFCRPLVCISPITVEKRVGNRDLEAILDDCTDEGKIPTTLVSLAAINHRSLLYLELDIGAAPDDEIQIQEDGPSPSEVQFESTSNGASAKKDETVKDNINMEIMDKIEALSLKIDQQNEEMQKLRNQDREMLLFAIGNLKDDFISQKLQIVKNIDSLFMKSVQGNAELLQEAQAKSNDLLIEYLSKSEVLKKSKDEDMKFLMEYIAKNVFFPTFNDILKNLFDEINSNFQQGLKEFMINLRRLSSEMLKSTPQYILPVASNNECLDENYIKRLINHGQIAPLLEKVLATRKRSTLSLMCSLLDPDMIFNSNPPIKSDIVLQLLTELSFGLNEETDVKFRYIESALFSLRIDDPVTKMNCLKIYANLHASLQTFIQNENDADLKRRAKMIFQVISNTLN